MKTVQNQLKKPLQVPLPRGKKLHLGPLQSGQIAVHDADHPPLAKLVSEGALRIFDKGEEGYEGHSPASPIHEQTHGHHPARIKKRGDR